MHLFLTQPVGPIYKFDILVECVCVHKLDRPIIYIGYKLNIYIIIYTHACVFVSRI